MPMKLTTTIRKIESIPNSKNVKIINEFLGYMRRNSSSEHHQNNNLKAIISFANFLGKSVSLYDIKNKEEVIEYLDTKIKSHDVDPDKKWITTWNDRVHTIDKQQKFWDW